MSRAGGSNRLRRLRGVRRRLGLPRLPSSRRDLRLVGRTVRLVIGVPAYAVLAAVVAVLALSGFVLSQNVALVRDTVVGGALPLDARLTILVEQYPFVGTSYEPAAGLMLLVVSLLTGANVAVAVYHVREHGILGGGGTEEADGPSTTGDTGGVRTEGGAGGAGGEDDVGSAGEASDAGHASGAGATGSLVGVVLGALGAGCAACGSAVLVGLLSLVGGSGLLLALPFEGVEFTLLALVPLLLSLFWLADGMRGAEIRGCPVDI